MWTAVKIRPYVEKGAREIYLGATPGKASKTGKDLIATYKTRTVNSQVEVLLRDGRWWPLDDCDMSHEPVDAVDFWNDTARPSGWNPKGTEVRDWMLNHKNYILEPSAENRSRGSRNKKRYLPP
jgi:hypothetical protein